MTHQAFNQISKLAKEVKQDLRKKGLVVPKHNKDGSISVDKFTILKQHDNYAILNQHREVMVANINLAQTAILLANGLALGRHLDTDLIKLDNIYGYNLFEEELTKKYVETSTQNQDFDKAELMLTKFKIAKHKRIAAKKSILASFEKLCRLR